MQLKTYQHNALDQPKDALKEGWDCSFAYVLALLDNTTRTWARQSKG